MDQRQIGYYIVCQKPQVGCQCFICCDGETSKYQKIFMSWKFYELICYTQETRIDFIFLNLYLFENALLHNVKAIFSIKLKTWD